MLGVLLETWSLEGGDLAGGKSPLLCTYIVYL